MTIFCYTKDVKKIIAITIESSKYKYKYKYKYRISEDRQQLCLSVLE